MLASKISKRYAKGLLLFAKEEGKVEDILVEMKDVLKFVSVSDELRRFLSSPFIHAKTKIYVAEKIFVKFSKTVQNIIILAIKQNREVYIGDIARQYINLVEEHEGIQRVSLTTAVEISEHNLESILKRSSLVDSSKPLNIEKIISPDIIGGYLLKVGDQQIDASVRTNLRNLKREFKLNGVLN